jgi:hypothetical protein
MKKSVQSLVVAVGSLAVGHAALGQQQVGRWNVVGSAQVTNDTVRLTNNSPQQTGAAYLRDKLFVRDGFDLTFNYAFTSSAAGEGLAFVVQNQSATAVGTGSTQLGITGLQNALAIAIRPGANGGVQVYGPLPGTGRLDASRPGAWNDSVANSLVPHIGADSVVRVRYVPGSLDVFINGVRVIAGLTVDLGNLGGRSAIDTNGRAWLGLIGTTSQLRTGEISVSGLDNITLIPAPGAAALLGLTALVAGRRRR